MCQVDYVWGAGQGRAGQGRAGQGRAGQGSAVQRSAVHLSIRGRTWINTNN